MIGMKDNPTWFWIPTLDGYQIFAIEKEKLIAKKIIPVKPNLFTNLLMICFHLNFSFGFVMFTGFQMYLWVPTVCKTLRLFFSLDG
jgi:hypothetical protein